MIKVIFINDLKQTFRNKVLLIVAYKIIVLIIKFLILHNEN